MGCGNLDNTFPEESLGGSVVESNIPLSNGLNVPNFGAVRSYSRFYTVCEYLPQNQKPAPEEFVQISMSESELHYFEEVLALTVMSYPKPVLKFPNTILWERVDYTHWRVYPNKSSKDFYVLFEFVLDSEDANGFLSHFNITLVGYDLQDSVPFDIPVSVVAGEEVAEFRMVLKDPFFEVSSKCVWLTESNGFSESVEVTSNLHWYLEF